MEKITDILKELKDRLSSPLLSSFVLSWLVFNWRIPVGLLFYKMEQLSKDGISSYFQLIEKTSNNNYKILYPAFLALAYTFIYPLVRNCISAFNEWIKAWGTRWNLYISKNGAIAVEHFLKLRSTYKDRTKILEEVISKESALVVENEQLRTEVLQLKDQNNNWNENYNRLMSYSNVSVYDGEWELLYLKDGKQLTKRVLIGNGNISMTDSQGQLNTIFIIKHLSYTASSSELTLIIEDKQGANNPEFFQIMRPRTPEKRTFVNTEKGAILQELRKV